MMSDGLDKILASLNKRYGKAVINNADEIKYPALERIRTGSLAIDVEIGGGIPRGRVTMIVANESAGKTTLALHIIKQAQKQEGRILFVDAEGTFDPEWAKTIGVDLTKLIVAVPDVGEQAADIIEAGIRSNECSLIVLDSIAALQPAAELDKPMIESNRDGGHESSPEQIGDRALMLNRAVRRLTSALNAITEQGERNSTAVILLNQFRLKIGGYGNPETIPGGLGIKFMSSIILELRKPGGKDGWIEEDRNGEPVKIGQEVRFKTQKNKTYCPFRTGTTYLMFDGPMKGQIDTIKELYTYGRLLGLISETAQAVFSIDGKKFRGQKQVEEYLRVNPKYCEQLENDIRERYLHGKTK